MAISLFRPSSSLLDAWSFIVDKKDKTLCPCTDYHCLIYITLHLTDPSFKPLCHDTLLSVSAEMPTIFFDKGGWVENSFQHPLRPLWVPCHAFQPLRNYINVPTLLAASRQWRQNYNVGIWEFLASTLPVQEWRYWLAGTKQPFIIRTDY